MTYDKINTDHIEAMGYLLSTYRSDLNYIRTFQRYKTDPEANIQYYKKSIGSFKAFLNEYRVARNVMRDTTPALLKNSIEWTTTENSNNVDEFAIHLRNEGITHDKVMTSLASKILFLNNPWKILPMDDLAKKGIGLKTNKYKDFEPLITDFEQNNRKFIDDCLFSIQPHLDILEEGFLDLPNINLIRQNRFIDKLLWTKGKNLGR